MSGPVPAEDDLLVLRFKRGTDPNNERTRVCIWAATSFSQADVITMLEDALVAIDQGTFEQML